MTTAKTNCHECSAEILATTADSTGGLYMPCKKGTRKNIDDSKRCYEERKEERKKYDPWRELWTALVERTHSTEGAWMQLSDAERFPETSVFSSLPVASDFFRSGSLGYSVTNVDGKYDGLELRCRDWRMEMLKVERIASSYFDDKSRFPADSIQFDCALLMRSIEH